VGRDNVFTSQALARREEKKNVDVGLVGQVDGFKRRELEREKGIPGRAAERLQGAVC